MINSLLPTWILITFNHNEKTGKNQLFPIANCFASFCTATFARLGQTATKVLTMSCRCKKLHQRKLKNKNSVCASDIMASSLADLAPNLTLIMKPMGFQAHPLSGSALWLRMSDSGTRVIRSAGFYSVTSNHLFFYCVLFICVFIILTD